MRNKNPRMLNTLPVLLLTLAWACGGGGGSSTGPTAPGAGGATLTQGSQDGGGNGGSEPIDTREVIRIEKSTNGLDADDRDTAQQLALGTPVTWVYEVFNLGPGLLSEIRVTDDQIGAIRCDFDRLAAGERGTCSAEGSVEQIGLYRNVGRVDAVYRISPTGFSQRVSATDPSHYVGVEEQPQPTGSEGCGLGYWKNHLADWPPTGYSPSQTVDSVFSASSEHPTLATSTLLEALQFGGGPGVEGGAMILLRHGVAALLNAAHPQVAYTRAPSAIVSTVNGALRSGSKQQMLSVKDDLEAANEGECPLG